MSGGRAEEPGTHALLVVLVVLCAVLQVVVSAGAGLVVADARDDRAPLVAQPPGPVTPPPPAGPSPTEPFTPAPLPSPLPAPAPTEAGGYAVPRPDRPVVFLTMDVAPDLTGVVGTEQVLFTPDLEVCDLVFRLWPNKPETALEGNDLRLTSASVDGVAVAPVIEPDGAPEGRTGTLARLPLATCATPGTVLDVALGWSLALGEDTPERVGYDAGQRLAWMATAFPLLAWEHGVGWMTDPAVGLFGETAGSEAFELRSLAVGVPTGTDVMGTGALQGVTQPGDRPGVDVHTFAAPSVRDVAVVVGDLDVVEQDVDGVRLHVATASAASPEQSTQAWADAQAESLRSVAAYLGPYPFTDLWVTVVDDFPTGVEFPGAILYTDTSTASFPELVPHETAHMWLYGLVGNDQGRDPWLDEGMTSFVEAQVMGRSDRVADDDVPSGVEGYLGGSMSFWAARGSGNLDYSVGVYSQGATVMARARAAAGAEAFDEALRGYVRTNAHRVATPADVQTAFASVPAAVDVLTDAGAFAGDEGDP